MKKIINSLKLYEQKCDEIIKKCERSKDVHSKLLISKSHNTTQYYKSVKTGEGKKKRIYIPKSEEKEIQKVAQKQYENTLYNLAEKRKSQLRNFLESFDLFEFDKVYDDMPSKLKKLVTPVIPTHKLTAEEWQSKPYDILGFNINDRTIFTKSKIRVRSKTEKNLIEIFEEYNIPFKYEAPLYIGDKTYRPDFTFLCPYTGKEIYWEHLGLIDDPEYTVKSLNKIKDYILAGIDLDHQLIITWEDRKNDLDYDLVYKYINDRLIVKDR